jgi:ABC-type dipeptide/oligopeptide/nickel transport system permease component
MELPDDHRDPARVVALWQRFWEDRAREFRPAAIRRAVRRYLAYPSPARLAELRLLDTAAVPDLVLEIARASDPATSALLLPIAERALDLPPLADPVARLERLQTVWRARGLDFVQLEPALRPVVAITETRYGKWALGAVAGDLGRARDGRAVLALVISASGVTMRLVVPGALAGVLAALAFAVATAARRSRGLAPMAVVLCFGAACPLVAGSFAGGAAGVAAFVLAAIAPGLSARFALTLESPVWTLDRATGASELVIALRALRAGPLPFALAALGATLPGTFTAAFVAEKLTGVPGLGRVAAEAVAARDIAVLMAIAVLASLSAIVALAVADLAQISGDPRVEDAP